MHASTMAPTPGSNRIQTVTAQENISLSAGQGVHVQNGLIIGLARTESQIAKERDAILNTLRKNPTERYSTEQLAEMVLGANYTPDQLLILTIDCESLAQEGSIFAVFSGPEVWYQSRHS